MKKNNKSPPPEEMWREKANKIIDAWPNLGMECEIDVLVEDIQQALQDAYAAGRKCVQLTAKPQETRATVNKCPGCGHEGTLLWECGNVHCDIDSFQDPKKAKALATMPQETRELEHTCSTMIVGGDLGYESDRKGNRGPREVKLGEDTCKKCKELK